MPTVHDKQSAMEMIEAIHWWKDKFIALGTLIKRGYHRLRACLTFS